MSNDFLNDRAPGRWRLILAGALAAALLIGLGAVVYNLVDTDDHNTPPNATPTTSPTATDVLGVNPDDLGALTVLPGSDTIDGVAVGYPHTIPGAVSAAAEYLAQYGSNLDIERGRTLAEIIADPDIDAAKQSMIDAPVNNRTALGLPPEGRVPTGTAITAAPVAYQLRNLTPDAILVLLLFYGTVESVKTGTKTAVGVVPLSMHWSAGDWKLGAPVNGDQYLSFATTPNTPEAAAAGWKGLMR